MDYKQARQYLEEIRANGDLLGLESIAILLEELGNPQDSLRFVHVAGTNGKGSVLAYLSGILKEAGCRAGRYLSPSLFCYEEKIRINDTYISREDLALLVTQIRQARDRIKKRGLPETTIFEVETALSFLYFKKKGCDLVLLETGMGGRDDATNIVRSTCLCIFTAIGLDHMQYLGNTIEEIALVKSGIIKPGAIVLSDIQEAGAAKVLETAAEKAGCPFYMLDEKQFSHITYGPQKQVFTFMDLPDLSIRLGGIHQIRNAALAVKAAKALKNCGFCIRDEDIRKGLEKTRWEGRFELLSETPVVVIDGAHNPNAAAKLMESMRLYYPGRTVRYVMGVFADKDYREIIKITAPLAAQIFTVETKDNPRALDHRKLAEAIQEVLSGERHSGPETDPGSVTDKRVIPVGDAGRALQMALAASGPDDVVLVFGSLSFLWEIREIFRKEEPQK